MHNHLLVLGPDPGSRQPCHVSKTLLMYHHYLICTLILALSCLTNLVSFDFDALACDVLSCLPIEIAKI